MCQDLVLSTPKHPNVCVMMLRAEGPQRLAGSFP